MRRSGTASLPLHTGRVPKWLATRMAALGSAIVEAVILFEGTDGFLKRLSDPYWFQSFGAVLGMDWHSSGITTSVMGALKRGLEPKASELGIHICGGRGRHSLRTPQELLDLSNRIGLDGDTLVKTSKLVAKVDNTAIQDGFSLYLHSFVVTDSGEWVVVQQGMNGNTKQARRYHWRSRTVSSFVEAPHEGVVGPNQGVIINLTDRRADLARRTSVEIARSGPTNAEQEFISALRYRNLQMPSHHEVHASDVFLRRLHGVIALANEQGVKNFEDLLLTKGLGPRTLQALALVSEVAFGAPSRFDDPARFAFAHGGKDGHPHPVPLKVYDKTIQSLSRAVSSAAIGHTDKIEAFKRLDRQAQALEKIADGPRFENIVNNEWEQTERYGGMTVFGPSKGKTVQKSAPHSQKKTPKQLKLFG